jgi:hypothetical protein
VRARKALGLLLVLHGLAHIALGMAAQDDPTHGLARWLPAGLRVLVATALFVVVTPGFVAAGFGAWNVPGLARIWFPLVRVAVLASFVLLAFTAASGSRLVVALVIDLLVLAFSDALVDAKMWRRAS